MEFYDDFIDSSHIQMFMVQSCLLLRGGQENQSEGTYLPTWWGGVYESGVGIIYNIYLHIYPSMHLSIQRMYIYIYICVRNIEYVHAVVSTTITIVQCVATRPAGPLSLMLS